MAFDDFLDVSGCLGMPFRPPTRFGKDLAKKKNRFFSNFLKQFLLHFSLKMKQKWIWKNRKSDFFKNEALNQKSGTVKPLGYVLTIFHDCGDPPDMKLAMPPASNSAHENHCFYSPSKLLELQSSFSSPKIDFWKCLSNALIRSNMASDDFLHVPKWSGLNFRPPTSFGNHLAKKTFFEFFWLFWSNFCFVLAWKWSKNGY